MNNKRYFQVHIKKGWFVAEETNDENVVINLVNDMRYSLKKEDTKEEVTAIFVAKALENDKNKWDSKEKTVKDYFLFFIGLTLPLLASYGFLTQTIRITLFQLLFFISLGLFLTINTIRLKNKLKIIYNKNYYTALKRIRY